MAKIDIKKSFKDGRIGVRVSMKSGGFHGDSVKVEGSADITTAEARSMAALLIARGGSSGCESRL
jgi:hypothetical protein